MYNKYQSDFKVKQEICEIGRRVYEKGFVASNDGNISVRVGPNEIWITPTGVSKGALTPDMLLKVNLQGEVLSGKLRPTSEMKMHLKVYEKRPDIRAVVHVHPPYATAFAIAGIPLNQATMPESVVLLGTIPLAEYATPSTADVPKMVEKYIDNHNGVLLENHGALTWGKDLSAAYYTMESLEFCAKINWIAGQMNGARELSKPHVQELIKLKEKMGLQSESPQGLSCSDDQTACLPEQSTESKLSPADLDKIVQMVTESVLLHLQQGGKL